MKGENSHGGGLVVLSPQDHESVTLGYLPLYLCVKEKSELKKRLTEKGGRKRGTAGGSSRAKTIVQQRGERGHGGGLCKRRPRVGARKKTMVQNNRNASNQSKRSYFRRRSKVGTVRRCWCRATKGREEGKKGTLRPPSPAAPRVDQIDQVSQGGGLEAEQVRS